MDTCNMVATIGQKIVETSLFGEQNNPHPFPLLYVQSWGVCSLEVARKASKYCVEGWGRVSLIFPFLSWQNVRKALNSIAA